jgi:anti-sigma regulatory factor (Ser/Thr protein kinase)
MHLAPEATAPHTARAFVRRTLHEWSLDALGDVTELLVSELVANVVIHAHSAMTLRAELGGQVLHVAVEDGSTELPVVASSDADDEHGRGMLLIAALADRWGAERRSGGKTVWFSLDARRS